MKSFVLRVKIFFCSLEPEWAAAATEVKEQTKGKVKLAAVDATVNQMLAARYVVSVSPGCSLRHAGFTVTSSVRQAPPGGGGAGC